jgi:hypothetical protein
MDRKRRLIGTPETRLSRDQRSVANGCASTICEPLLSSPDSVPCAADPLRLPGVESYAGEGLQHAFHLLMLRL